MYSPQSRSKTKPPSQLQRIITGVRRRFFPAVGTPNENAQGYKRANYNFSTYNGGGSAFWFDEEIVSVPIRHARVATLLQEINRYCPEVAKTIEVITDDVFSSEDGDDQGWKIADEKPDGTPVNARIKKELDLLILNVIGGRELRWAVEGILEDGDAFGFIILNKELTSIERIMELPTWELFRIEDDQGVLEKFEQRQSIYDTAPIQLEPILTVHWRYRKDKLYGRALALELLPDWEDLKEVLIDKRRASRAIGINPNVHKMPKGTNDAYKNAYADDLELRRRDGIITDYFIGGYEGDGDVTKVASQNPDLEGILSNYEAIRRRLVASLGAPPYALGVESSTARDVSGAPALMWARKIGNVRGDFTVGLRQICDLQLALKGIDPRLPENQYKIKFPDIHVNAQMAEMNKPDEDEEPSKEESPKKDEKSIAEDALRFWKAKHDEMVSQERQ